MSHISQQQHTQQQQQQQQQAQQLTRGPVEQCRQSRLLQSLQARHQAAQPCIQLPCQWLHQAPHNSLRGGQAHKAGPEVISNRLDGG
jgi:hypothetical protein